MGADLAMWDILFGVIEVSACFRNLQTARFVAVPKIAVAGRIVDEKAIDVKPIVMKAGHSRRSRDRPYPFVTADHLKRLLEQARAAFELHLLCVRRTQAEGHRKIGSDSWIFRTADVTGRRQRIGGPCTPDAAENKEQR